MLFALFWMFVGATGAYLLASAVFAQRLDEERRRIHERMRRWYEETPSR